ncbi:hypothetical protein [Haloferax sp. EPS crtB]|uniref:hypothetical protein n=1 Tax=Haloferax sp. EPS crtB TaxID=3451361 RepID=UPI00403F0931
MHLSKFPDRLTVVFVQSRDPATEFVSTPALLAVDEDGIVPNVGYHSAIDGVVGFTLQIFPPHRRLVTGTGHCP